MPELSPAPSTLHLASPALGPWFTPDTDTPTLPLPDGDLAVQVTLSPNMEWRAPANALRSYAFATATRSAVLATLRAESGAPAFTDGAFVVLLTLLPEVELRLAAISFPLPAPDNAPQPAGVSTRPRVRSFALEIEAGAADTIGKIEKLRPDDLDPALSDVDKALFLGLSGTAQPSNGAGVTELCRPNTDSAVAVRNRSAASLVVKLWCFDHRGRALDPGAVAAWWAFLASDPSGWTNLWAHDDQPNQRTAAVSNGRVVALVNAHEGALDEPTRARLNLTGLTQVTDSTALYTLGTSPAIALTAVTDPNTDILPVPRIAALPNGAYAAPGTATPFAGWTGTTWPTTLLRDFLRVALTDVESHLVGLSRADPVQANARRRVTAGRNTVAAPFLATADAVVGQAMAVLSSGAATLMAPVMDPLWGATTPPATFGAGPLPDALAFTPRALAGEGTATAGGSVSGQTIALHFEAGSLPAAAWVRVWSLGIDTTTGRRFRQDGGAAVADVAGEAFVILPIPDGDATAALSADALVVVDGGSRLYVDLRYDRPAVVSGTRVSLTSPGGAALRNTTTGQPFVVGGGGWRSGDRILADTGGTLALADLATLTAADTATASLLRAAGTDDALVVTQPAFGQTPDGGVVGGLIPGGAILVRRVRSGLTQVGTLGQPVPSQERRELAGRSATGAGVIGGAPGRATLHEAPPPQLGHAGLPAGPEVHAPGLALAGPAADPLRLLMIERRATDLRQFVPLAGVPFTPTVDPGGTTPWTAVLETTTHGMAGDAAVRAVLELTGGAFTPGQSWLDLKAQVEAAVPGIDLDSVIDTANFDDDQAAAALDRLILKTKEGAREFATAALAAIGRAEDLVYVETPALDALTAAGGIDLVAALTARLGVRPGLCVVLIVPERFLPDETAKIETVRKGTVGAARKALESAAPGRVALAAPHAGPGRALHLASTTIVVDDAILLTGAAHLWRRGLTFDSSLAAGLFDETVTAGRPAAVRAARLQLMANALALPLALVPEDAVEAVQALRALDAAGGKGRVAAGAYPPADDPTSPTDHEIWNPDGGPAGTSDWFAFLADLTGPAATEFNNAIR